MFFCEKKGVGMETIHSYLNIFLRRIAAKNQKGEILYIHGLGESGFCFEQLCLDSQISSWSHWIPDLFGYGQSPRFEKPVSLEDHTRYLKDLLDALKISRVIIVGHSMGGVIGLLFCEKYPHLVEGFINVEGNISAADCTFSRRIADFSSDDFLTKGFRKISEEIYRDAQTNQAVANYYLSFRRSDPGTLYLNSQELITLSESEELPERFAKLEMPKTYIFGNPDGTGDHSIGLLTKAGVSVVEVGNAGHWPFIDQQDTFIEKMISFLDNLGNS